MKTSTVVLILVVLATGGLALWFVSRQSAIQRSPVATTGTSSPWDILNPFRTLATRAGLQTSSADRTLQTIQSVSQAAPELIGGLGKLFGSVGSWFKSSPSMSTSNTFTTPAPGIASTGFIGQVDYTPSTSIDQADSYFG